MKKTKKAIVKILMVLAVFMAIGFLWNLESTYTREATITHIDQNTITATDKKGFIWQFNGNGYHEGQQVKLIMHDNHTSTIKDDIIKNVK